MLEFWNIQNLIVDRINIWYTVYNNINIFIVVVVVNSLIHLSFHLLWLIHYY